MANPFRTPLVIGSPSPVANDPSHGIAAQQLDTDGYNPGDNDAVPLGNVNDAMQGTAPEETGRYGLDFNTTTGLTPSTHSASIITDGAVDMATGWDVGGQPSHTTMIDVDGPVNGGDSVFTQTRQELPTFNPQYDGPVSGGADYATALAQAQFATQAAQYSQAAVAAALVSAV